MLGKSNVAIGRRLLEIKALAKRVEANGLLFRDWGSTPHGSNFAVWDRGNEGGVPRHTLLGRQGYLNLRGACRPIMRIALSFRFLWGTVNRREESMGCWSRTFLMLVMPLLMAAVAAARTEDAAAIMPSDEADAPVERVIKAAQEIHLDQAPVLDLAPKPHTSESGWYLGGHLVNLTGDAPPEEMLLNAVPTFADGPRIESDVRVEAYRLGYRFPISTGLERDAQLPVSMHSVVGVAVVDARYELEGPEHVQMEQGFFKGAPLMGLEMDWPLTRNFSLAGETSSTLPLSSMPWIFSGRVLGRYHLAGPRNGGVRAFGGVGYERIWVEDRSNVISDINSDSGPMLIFGVEARF
jgi:hypothetical protein